MGHSHLRTLRDEPRDIIESQTIWMRLASIRELVIGRAVAWLLSYRGSKTSTNYKEKVNAMGEGNGGSAR